MIALRRTMESQAPKGAITRQLALRFISGKYQGGEYPLGSQPELIVGRSSDLDMVLVEDMVSRRHARITVSENQIQIEDLGSTNGTFVNGEKISRASLKEGDRVLIGTSILKVVAVDPNAPALRRPEMPAAGRGAQTRTMSGSIDEIPLPDLLQLLGSSKKSGALVVRSEDDVGKIFLRKGVVVFASINDLPEVPPLKSIFRILTWGHGSFDLAPLDERPIPGEISATVQELLMEGLRQIDELNVIRDRLPDLGAQLFVPHPLAPKLSALSPMDLEIFQIAYNHQHLSTLLNQSPGTDLETAKSVLGLIENGYLRIA
ncbi:GGDEF domain protein [Minicystis rosea]|nr:GGDEF domain protein [Minicystis rosea]